MGDEIVSPGGRWDHSRRWRLAQPFLGAAAALVLVVGGAVIFAWQSNEPNPNPAGLQLLPVIIEPYYPYRLVEKSVGDIPSDHAVNRVSSNSPE